MAKTLHNGCCVIRDDIHYCSTDHTYVHLPTKRKLTSVSKVIQCVYSTKTWDGVDPSIIENARRRGDAVDKYMSQYIRERRVVVEGEQSDVIERLKIAHRIWEQKFSGLKAQPQKIVFSLEDGIAGTIDFLIEGEIVADLKCTYSREHAWVLQLGAYLTYSDAHRGGVIHISPRTYPDGGTWIEYNPDTCRHYWKMALAWWKETRSMEKL